MTQEHEALHAVPVSPAEPASHGDPNYWNALIDEDEAGDFLGLTDRTMQKMRRDGGGPPYVRISSRCLRYRRVDLKTWADARMRRSTSDPGLEAA